MVRCAGTLGPGLGTETPMPVFLNAGFSSPREDHDRSPQNQSLGQAGVGRPSTSAGTRARPSPAAHTERMQSRPASTATFYSATSSPGGRADDSAYYTPVRTSCWCCKRHCTVPALRLPAAGSLPAPGPPRALTLLSPTCLLAPFVPVRSCCVSAGLCTKNILLGFSTPTWTTCWTTRPLKCLPRHCRIRHKPRRPTREHDTAHNTCARGRACS